ncbi:MAG: aminotransferase class V-fold PLP-dependent enzyme [Halobacteriota archaeon]
MTPLELRADVPAFTETTYLNTGASGPSPKYVVEAAQAVLEAHEYDAPLEDGMYPFAFDRYERLRERVASFVGADAEEIALTNSTVDGINRVAGAIDWQPGDVVVRTDLEHPAGVLPWERLRSDGVDVRVVETSAGTIDLEQYESAVEDARLVCFSAITWTHGTELPVETLTEIAHEHDTFVLVDAVQVPGQTHLDVRDWGADAVVAAGHKWLLGLWGAGILYVDSSIAAELQPRSIGYRSVTDPLADPYEYKQGAARFELGTRNLAPHVGLVEAMDAIDRVGVSTIETRIGSLTEKLKDSIPAERLLSPREFESGLVTIDVDDPEETVEQLNTEGIVVRSIDAMDAIRISVHAVNTESEIDDVLRALEFD